MGFRKFGSPERIEPVEVETADPQGIEVTVERHEPVPAEEIIREGEEGTEEQ